MLMNLLQRLKNWGAPSTTLQQIKPTSITTSTTSNTLTVSLSATSTTTDKHLRTLKLIMVTAENNNKYYEMRENDNDTFTVQYGRVGGTYSTATYPVASWDKKFREKVSKGYVDQTHLYADSTATPDASTIKNPSVRTLMARLMELANLSIFQNYVVTAQQVTRKQVETAQQVLDELAALVTLNLDTAVFNNKLLDLFKTIPRKMGKVHDHLVLQTPQSADDLQSLHDQLASEQDTLDVMRGQVELAQSQLTPEETPVSLLDSMNLTVEPVTDKRALTLIKQMMGPDVDKFDAAFSVKQAATEIAFDRYVQQRPNPKTQLLWHGSRSENWMSILKTGLLLRPANAVITGKMFGYGIYFADQFSKSLNYTSLHGSVWAKGSQQEAYLAIYEVHVGEQFLIKQHEGWHMSLDKKGLENVKPTYDSVFACRGVSLQKNEFIVYHPAQCTVRYIVKIKA
jgi:poly [ADP-ribose] polymerase